MFRPPSEQDLTLLKIGEIIYAQHPDAEITFEPNHYWQLDWMLNIRFKNVDIDVEFTEHEYTVSLFRPKTPIRCERYASIEYTCRVITEFIKDGE